MKIERAQISPTEVELSVSSDERSLGDIKDIILKDLGKDMTLPGFRKGKAPLHLVEKQLGESLQSEFLNDAVNGVLDQAIRHENFRVVSQPEVSLTKFVPYTTLEFKAKMQTLGEVKLPDLSKIKLPKKPVQ
ncbi:MAG: trigger factor family protein, partial [Candidatus Saccharimonadales bacterium]